MTDQRGDHSQRDIIYILEGQGFHKHCPEGNQADGQQEARDRTTESTQT